MATGMPPLCEQLMARGALLLSAKTIQVTLNPVDWLLSWSHEQTPVLPFAVGHTDSGLAGFHVSSVLPAALDSVACIGNQPGLDQLSGHSLCPGK